MTEQTWPTAPTDPTVYALPEEPAGPVWDKDGRKWERQPDGYWASPYLTMERHWVALLHVYGPLWTTPPVREWAVGDIVKTASELVTLPVRTIAIDPSGNAVQLHPDGWYTADVNETPWEPYELDYPFTIIWIPKEQA